MLFNVYHEDKFNSASDELSSKLITERKNDSS